MKLSLIVMTRNGSWRLERLLHGLADRVDEVVVGIDDATDDDTEVRARRYTQSVFRIRNPQGYIEPHIGALFERCTGDWVLRLDDDELISSNFSLEALPSEVLAEFDLIGFPRAWLVQHDPPLYIGTGKGGELVPQFRLMKRSGSWSFIPTIHTPGFEMKPAYVVDDMYMFHMSLLDKPAEVRRAQYDFYQSVRDAPWNKTYLLNPRECAATGRAMPCTPQMFAPNPLICSTPADYRRWTNGA